MMSRRWSESPEELPDSPPSEIENVKLRIEKATSQFSIRNFKFLWKATPRNSKRGRSGGNAAATQDGNREQTRRGRAED